MIQYNHKDKDSLKNQKGFETMEEKKVARITKTQKFEDVIAILSGETPKHVKTNSELIEFIRKEIELIANKSRSNGKETETQKQNKVLMEHVYAYLLTLPSDVKGATCLKIARSVPELNDFGSQKIAYLTRELAEQGRVESEVVKGDRLWRVKRD